MKHQPFSARRAALIELIGDGVAVIPTAPERVRNRDSHHPYRFDSYFWYLSGFREPEAAIVLVGGKEPDPSSSAAPRTRSARSGTDTATAPTPRAKLSASTKRTTLPSSRRASPI